MVFISPFPHFLPFPLNPSSCPQNPTPNDFLEAGIFKRSRIVTEGEEEDPAIPEGMRKGHDMRGVLRRIIGLHQMVRPGRVVFEIIQFIRNRKVRNAPGDGMIRVGHRDAEIHIVAVAVEECVEHAMIAFTFLKRSRSGMQTEKPATLFDKTEQALFLLFGEIADIGKEEDGIVTVKGIREHIVITGTCRRDITERR